MIKQTNRSFALTRTLLALATVATAATGCLDTDADLEDGEADSFVADGKADGLGAAEGSLTADAVLRVANSLSKDDLRKLAKVSATSAKRIADHRAGQDGALGTSDDNFIATLAELDGIPYVGPITYDKLEAYATEHADTYVQPFSCVGEAITDEQFLGHFEPGSGGVNLKQDQFYDRWRQCTTLTGCTVWSEAKPTSFEVAVTDGRGFFGGYNYYPLTYTLGLALLNNNAGLGVSLKLANVGYYSDSWVNHSFEGTTIETHTRQWPAAVANGPYINNGAITVNLGGDITSHCIAFRRVETTKTTSSTTWTEREYGLRANF